MGRFNAGGPDPVHAIVDTVSMPDSLRAEEHEGEIASFPNTNGRIVEQHDLDLGRLESMKAKLSFP